MDENTTDKLTTHTHTSSPNDNNNGVHTRGTVWPVLHLTTAHSEVRVGRFPLACQIRNQQTYVTRLSPVQVT